MPGLTMQMQMNEYRPCLVGEKKGLFHQWIHFEEVILKTEMLLTNDALRQVLNRFRTTGVIPHGFVIDGKITMSMALVEFEDGTIRRIRSEDIRFIDTSEMFYAREVYFRMDKMKEENTNV